MKKGNLKTVRSENYNYIFNRKTGFFARWGKTKEDDPDYSPIGTEIADIEISTICEGIGSGPCRWCYKSNTKRGENMSHETFVKLFHKLPKTLTQIAFGIGNIGANPDLFNILSYCRNNDYNYVIPNITINGYNLTNEYVDKLVELCGAVAVSRYKPKDICYDAVKKLTDKGLEQTNIHMLISEETYEDCFEVMRDSKTDPRLKKLNAIVFLTLKPKGKRNSLKGIKSLDKYKKVIDYALENNIRIGFDSCSAPLFMKAIENTKYSKLSQFCEPCEAYLFSMYINVKGKTVPCSFCEGEEGYDGIDMLKINDFMKDVWYNKEVIKFRKKLLGNCRNCPVFDLYEDKKEERIQSMTKTFQINYGGNP